MAKLQKFTYRCSVYQEPDSPFTGVCLDWIGITNGQYRAVTLAFH